MDQTTRPLRSLLVDMLQALDLDWMDVSVVHLFPPLSPEMEVQYSEDEESSGEKGYKFEFDEFGEAMLPTSRRRKKGGGAGGRRKRFPAGFKKRVVKYYHVNGRSATMDKFGLGSTTVHTWSEAAANGAFDLIETDAEDGSTQPRVVAPKERLYDGQFPEEFKRQMVKLYYKNGPAAIVAKYGLSAALLHKWVKASPVLEFDDVHEPDVEEASKLISEVRVAAAAQAVQASVLPMLVDKTRKRSLANARYTAELKAKILNYEAKRGLKKTVEKFGVSIASVRNWRLRWEAGDFKGVKADPDSESDSPIERIPTAPKPPRSYLPALLHQAEQQIKAVERSMGMQLSK
jgi:transposase-like protein